MKACRAVAAACTLLLSLPIQAEAQGLSATVTAPQPNPDGTDATTVSADSFAGQAVHVGDLVELAPGTSVMDYGGALATTVVSVRGASADEVQVVFDGVPLNASVGGGFDLSLIPSALVDSVEVQRGSEGANIGAGAMGGAVLISPVARSRAILTFGTLGTYGASGSWASPVLGSGWHILTAVDYRHTDGDFLYHLNPTPEIPNADTLTLPRENNDASLASTLLRVEHALWGGQFSGLLLLDYEDRGLPGDIYSPTLTARQQEGDGFLDLRWRSAPTGRWSEEVPLTIKGGILDASDPGLGGSSGFERIADLAARPTASVRLADWKLTASGLLGYEGFSGAAFGDRQRVRGALGVDALFVRGDWSAELAVRGEEWGNAGAILPHVGGTYRVARGVTLAASGGLGFRPPSFGELYYSSGPVMPNPNLLPERSYSGDLGVRLHFGPFSGSASGFAGYYQDLIVYELYPGFRSKPENIGASRAYGGEIEARLRPQGRWTGFELLVSGTEMVTQSLVPGPDTYDMEVPYRPQQRLVARVDYRRESWRVGAEVLATSIAYINESNTRWVPAYADLRFNAGARLWGPFWLSVEVRNALDVMDLMNIDGYPLPGRVVLANLTWEPGEGTP